MTIDKENLLKRVVTAVFWVAVLLVVFYLGGMSFSVVITGMALLSFYEYQRMMAKMGKRIPVILTLLGGLAILGNRIFVWELTWSMLLIPVFILMGIQMVLTYPAMDFIDIGLGIFGLFYTFVFYTYFLDIRAFPSGFFWILLVMVLIWVGDSAAYFVGMNFGKNKLSPNLSPKKSIEGAVGGIGFTIAVALVVGFLSAHFTPLQGLGLGLLVGVVAIFGDLLESSIKRSAGVKDSGKFLPGHGGVLDRFDSALLVVPLAYFYIAMVIF